MTELAQHAATDVALLPPSERAVVVLGSTNAEAQIREIMKESAEITVVTDSVGRELAHKSGMKLKNARTSIEKIGKGAREDAQAFSKAVIAEEKRLKDIMAAEEARIFALRDEYDRQIAAEKEARERVERERIDSIKKKIDGFMELVQQSADDSAEQISASIEELIAYPITEEDFAEFIASASVARETAVERLTVLRNTAQAREDAAKAVAEERARLQAEREAIEAERRELEELRAQMAAAKSAQESGSSPVEVAPNQVQDSATSSQDNAAEVPEIAENDQTNVETPDGDSGFDEFQSDADAVVCQIANATAMQFFCLATKVEAVGDAQYATELRSVATRISAGEFDAQIKSADWTALGNADKEIALASHACVSLIFGDSVMGASVLLEAAE